jgi:lambda repressor-like predicted transcriptional regulator
MKSSEVIANQICGELKKNGKPVSDLCKEIGMSSATWARRMQDPYSFTAKELRILLTYISLDTFRLIIPNKKLKGEQQ